MTRTPLIARRSTYDAEIVRLALPAFGALAAEPLYVLADTAIVGQLGTRPLAGLAVAGILLTAAYALFNFLAYSTTSAVARQLGAGNRKEATALGVDGMWLAFGIGLVLMVLGVVLAPVLIDLMGASARARPFAITYLRISAVGAPAMLVMIAGTGYLRGIQDTKTTLVIAVASNVLNLVLEVLFVYGFDWGISGSAWGTVAAQLAGATAYVWIIQRSVRADGASPLPSRDGVRHVAVVGGPLIVRTASLLVTLLAMTNLAARIGDVAVAAHQIAFQIMLLMALSLDALAVAAQAMVGRFLGASTPHDARAAARRMLEWGVVVGIGFGVVLALVRPWLVPIFSDDIAVQDLASELLLIVAALQPLAAVVFVLDGVLMGAGDQRYLALAMIVATVCVFAPAAAVVVALGGGIVALWGALALWFVARAAGLGIRYVTPAWLVTGAMRR